MPYSISKTDGMFEVRVWGETSAQEVIRAVGDIHIKDPRKQSCDLWVVSPESVVPLAAYASIVESISAMCGPDFVGSKTAIVATSAVQLAELEMYRAEAARLPYPIRIFASRDDALAWLKT